MKTSEQIKDYLKNYSVGCAEAQAEKNGLLTALKIAEAHEAEYGWLPIATAPKTSRKLTLVKDYEGNVHLVKYSQLFEMWNEHAIRVYPVKWYRFEGNETK